MDTWVKRWPVVIVASFLFPVALTMATQHGLARDVGLLVLVIDVVVVLLCVEPIQRRLPWKFVARKELTEDFWQRAFDALPFPAFIKEFPKDEHVRDNDALRQFQGKKPAGVAEAELAAIIQRDHQKGDTLAEQEGSSVQLELTDKVTTMNPRPILTLKSCIDYDHRTYVVGCYVPVIRPSMIPSGSSFEVAGCGGQVVFSCPTAAASDDNNLVVTIGESLRVPHPEPPE